MGIALPIMTWSAASQAPWAAVPLHLLPGAEAGAASGASSYLLPAAPLLSVADPAAAGVADAAADRFPVSGHLHSLIGEAQALRRGRNFAGAIPIYHQILGEEQRLRGEENPLTLLHLSLCLRQTGRPEEAVAALERAIQIKPHPRAWYELAANLVGLQRHAQALDAIENAISLEEEPKPSSHFLKGVILRSLKRLEEAVRSFSIAIALEKGSYPTSYFELGRTFLEMGKYDDAIVNARLGLERRGKKGEGMAILGAAYFYQGKSDEAISILNEGIAQDPGDPFLYTTLSEIYRTMGFGEKALQVLDTAPAALRNHGRLVEARVATLAALSRHEEARAVAEAASGAPRLPGVDPLGDARNLRHDGRLEQARKLLEAVVKSGMATLFIFRELGIVLRILGEYRQAAAMLTEAIQKNPNLPRSFFERAIVYSLLREFPKALADIDEAIRLGGGNHSMSFAVKGGLLRKMELLEESESFLRAALRQFPGDGAVLLELGLTLRNQEKWEEAAAVLEKSLEKDPQNSKILSKLARLFRRLGRFQKALALLERAIRITPSTASLQFESALLLFGLHRHGEALAMLERAAKLGYYPQDIQELKTKIGLGTGGK